MHPGVVVPKRKKRGTGAPDRSCTLTVFSQYESVIHATAVIDRELGQFDCTFGQFGAVAFQSADAIDTLRSWKLRERRRHPTSGNAYERHYPGVDVAEMTTQLAKLCTHHRKKG
ncbi:hypothetical protein LMG27177_06858 [Paraburkholderia fynbosensis]|uniref:Uncharacterized protein n=1 Tax=Paraburkholderia fynbosensis TaxID=1200993 RepID=A0A6J5H656_9BURK|nr:hypothetical protein LMG27177_06858 [Paraburkholderia fynbosensis]